MRKMNMTEVDFEERSLFNSQMSEIKMKWIGDLLKKMV
jgi:hypothetical protein